MPTRLPDAQRPRHRPSLGLRAVLACVRRENEEEHGTNFVVVRETQRPLDPTRPLLIVVHPGDAVEHPVGWRPEDWRKVLKVSRIAQTGMAAELNAWRQDGVDTVVLHRRSSDLVLRDQNAGWQNEAYRQEVQQLGRSGALLYGDALEDAAAWIAEHAQVGQRPRVMLTGAYSTLGHGCVSMVGQWLQERFPHVPFTMSPFSPTSSSNDDLRWEPAPVVPVVPSVPSPGATIRPGPDRRTVDLPERAPRPRLR